MEAQAVGINEDLKCGDVIAPLDDPSKRWYVIDKTANGYQHIGAGQPGFVYYKKCKKAFGRETYRYYAIERSKVMRVNVKPREGQSMMNFLIEQQVKALKDL